MVKRYRVYIDRFDSLLPWSLDEGDTSTEQHFADVQFKGCSGLTGINLTADNRIEPKAWIACSGALVITGDIAQIWGGGESW